MGKLLNLFGKKQVEVTKEPLYISHLDGKVKGNPNLTRPSTEDFGERIQRIRTSLDKINKLMAELKRQSKEKKT